MGEGDDAPRRSIEVLSTDSLHWEAERRCWRMNIILPGNGSPGGTLLVVGCRVLTFCLGKPPRHLFLQALLEFSGQVDWPFLGVLFLE
jgi:hypothetical protein